MNKGYRRGGEVQRRAFVVPRGGGKHGARKICVRKRGCNSVG